MEANVKAAMAVLPIADQRVWQMAFDAKALASAPQNLSGITPTEFNVLILPNAVEEVTKGGIIRPVETLDKDKYAQMEGRIVAVSPLAFTYVTESEWNGQKPGVGDRIIIAKYAGTRVKGDDGVEYVLMKDRDVTAVRK